MILWRNAVMAVVFGGGVLGLGAALGAQEPAPDAPKAGQPAHSVDQWVADLGAESFKVRLQAERELRRLGKPALPALKKAAQGEDGEIQWRARRLVRQIESGLGGLQERDPGDRARAADPGDPSDPRPRLGRAGDQLPDFVRERFEDLFGRFERDFGLDIPRARFFGDDFFRDLQEQLRQGAQGGGMKMQVGPDGVRVEIQQKNDQGEVENKVYEAPDLETFRARYPGVLERHGLGLRLWGDGSRPLPWRTDAPDFPFSWQGPRAFAPRAPGDDEPVAVAPPPEDRRLGVTVRPAIAAELREHLGLDEGVGLQVESVQPDTLAASLGLQRGDIVIRIGDRPIGSAQDVQQALSAIAPGADVEVRWLRKGGERSATSKKPAPAAAKDAPAEPPAERLERRKTGGTIR